MKSIIKYIFLILFPIAIISCEKNEVVPDDISHSVITTSFGTQAAVLQVNDVMSFVDLSRGVVSREWIFPDGVATDTLGNPISVSNSSDQKIRFIQYGDFYIKVKQTFKDKFFLDTEFVESTTHEESIKVMVLDSVRAAYTAVNLADNSSLNIASGAKNAITAGSTVRFVVTSTGSPANNTFTVYNDDSGVVATGSATEDAATGEIYSDIQLPMPGIFNVKLASSNDFGYSEVELTDIVEIIPSMEPIYLNSISRATTTPSNVITLEFSRGMVMQEPFSFDGFKLAVTNGAKTIDISVTDVATESNKVNLSLSDVIYSSDIVFLSYDNTIAPLAACDNPETIQESFENSSVTFKTTDMLSDVGYDAGFETVENNTWGYLWWGGQWGKYVSEMSSAQAHSGTKSFKMEMSNRAGFGQWGCTDVNEKSGSIIGNKVETFPVEADKVYILGVWTYIESISPNLGSASTDLIFSINENTTWDNQMPFDSSAPVGEWVHRTQQIPAGSYTGDATILIRGNNADFATPFIIYLDDLTLSEAEPRP